MTRRFRPRMGVLRMVSSDAPLYAARFFAAGDLRGALEAASPSMELSTELSTECHPVGTPTENWACVQANECSIMTTSVGPAERAGGIRRSLGWCDPVKTGQDVLSLFDPATQRAKALNALKTHLDGLEPLAAQSRRLGQRQQLPVEPEPTSQRDLLLGRPDLQMLEGGLPGRPMPRRHQKRARPRPPIATEIHRADGKA